MVSRQETFKTYVALKLQDSHHGFSSDQNYERMQNFAITWLRIIVFMDILLNPPPIPLPARGT